MNQKKTLGTSLEVRVVEKAQQKGLRAKKQPLSGVLKDFPSDVVIENILGECKVRAWETTSSEKSIRVPYEWLDRVKGHAGRMGYEDGAVFIRPKGSERLLVLISGDFFLGLLKERKQITSGENEKR